MAKKQKDERRHFGHLYQRGKVWWIRYSVDGKRYRESGGTKKEAEALLSQRQTELGKGEFVEPDVKRTTFDDLADIIRDDYRVNNRRSTRRLETSLKHLGAAFAKNRATAITTDRINAYIAARLDEGAAPGSVQKELAALKRMFTLAVRARRVIQRPHIPGIELDNTREGFIEEDDLRALLGKLPVHLAPVIEFAWLTGWRIPSEVLTLTWRQVDFSAGVVRLEPGTTKNRRGREFPFDEFPRLKALLEEQRERTRALERRTDSIIPTVFWRGKGRPIGTFYKAWRSALEAAATEEVNGRRVVTRPQLLGRIPHDLRRSAVRNLTRAGVPKVWAKKLTGHETDSVFDRYDIAEIDDLREAIRRRAAHGDRAAGDTEGAQAR